MSSILARYVRYRPDDQEVKLDARDFRQHDFIAKVVRLRDEQAGVCAIPSSTSELGITGAPGKWVQ